MTKNGVGWFIKLINSKFTLEEAMNFCDNTSWPNNYIRYPFRCMTGYSQDSLLSLKYLVLEILCGAMFSTCTCNLCVKMICVLYNEAVSVQKILTSPRKPKEEHEISQSKNTESNQVHKITYTPNARVK